MQSRFMGEMTTSTAPALDTAGVLMRHERARRRAQRMSRRQMRRAADELADMLAGASLASGSPASPETTGLFAPASPASSSTSSSAASTPPLSVAELPRTPRRPVLTRRRAGGSYAHPYAALASDDDLLAGSPAARVRRRARATSPLPTSLACADMDSSDAILRAPARRRVRFVVPSAPY
jgi:hypothetical protein